MPIRVLETHVAAKIAAGEVVERPASVVKELVENSLDAGASRVIVEVEGGGTGLIRVTDNGSGIAGDEVDLAFHRHATSKIASVPDLDSIGTLGFRGEALASIAAVSRMSLVTQTQDAPAGREVRLEWGRIVKSGAQGCPTGTSVSVQGLFENLPARRKFLKSPSAETGRISDLVSRYALAYPEVQFRLLVDSRNSLTSPGNGVLADALVFVYGAEIGRAMLELSWQGPGDGYRVEGLISAPSLHRANRSYITFLVNRRWVQSPLLSYALAECYRGFLPEKRHPLAVIGLTVPLADVDVNVHPGKREVRCRQEDRVFSSLQRAVRATLIATSPVPEVRLDGATTTAVGPAGSLFTSAAPRGDRRQAGMLPHFTAGESSPTPVEAMVSLRILGQVRNTYLAAEGPDGLYLIDQHAAHERVLFEQVSKGVSGEEAQVQSLLDPMAVELSPSQEDIVQASAGLLEKYGFLLEPFGERTYLLRAVPAVVKDASPSKALLEVLDLLAYEGLLKEREEALAASIACHTAVRAGMGLSQQEMEELIRQLESCDSPHTCPHGRPTMIHLSSHHLEREFGRR